MKKLSIVLFLILIFTGCTTQNTLSEKDKKFFKKIPDQYIYSANSGGWGTQLNIADNGTFTGKYFDIDRHNKGEKYKEGTAYICNFSGEFCDVEKVDDHTYTMKVKRFAVENHEGGEYIEGGIKYIYAKPYGMENADVLKVYLPDKPTSELDDEYFMWDSKAENLKKLSHYSIYNPEDKAVFIQTDK